MHRSSQGSSHAATPLPHDGSTGSSTASSDFFSPISMAYFHNHRPETTPSQTPSSSLMRLPPSHDNSWIGARLSPIHSFDREEPDDSDQDENEDPPPARPPSHQPVNRRIWKEGARESSQQTMVPSKLPAHEPRMKVDRVDPFPNEPYPPSRHAPPIALSSHQGSLPWSSAVSMEIIGSAVCTFSGIHLFGFMGLYDVFLSHQGTDGWTWPFGIPSYTTLLRWGALSFYSFDDEESSSSIWFDHRNYYLSFVSSLIVCTSAVEWLLIVLAWRMLYVSSIRQLAPKQEPRSAVSEAMHAPPSCVRYTWYQVGSMYVLSAFVGQLWMWTFDAHFVAVGCVSWGTCGVLCTMGMSVPMYRFELFIIAACVLMLSLLLRPYSSVHGTAGSACFGWALGALLYVEPHPLQDRHVLYVGNRNDVKGMKAVTFMGTVGTVLVVSLPVLSLAFRT